MIHHSNTHTTFKGFPGRPVFAVSLTVISFRYTSKYNVNYNLNKNYHIENLNILKTFCIFLKVSKTFETSACLIKILSNSEKSTLKIY